MDGQRSTLLSARFFPQPMSRSLGTLACTMLLATVALLGLAPTATADDCADACVENCRAGIATGGAAAYCDVGHQPTGTGACLWTGCGDVIATCSALVHGQNPNCELYQQDTTVCTGTSDGEPPQWGICVAVYENDCMVWMYNDLWTQCVLWRPVN